MTLEAKSPKWLSLQMSSVQVLGVSVAQNKRKTQIVGSNNPAL